MTFFMFFRIALLIGILWFYVDPVVLLIVCKGKTTGKIIYVEQKQELVHGRVRQKYYRPVYEFFVDGKSYKSPSKEYGNSEAKFIIGTEKKVKYCPTNPEKCIINGRLGINWAEILLLIGVIALFFI